MSTVRTGEYINVFNDKYDVHVILGESNDPPTIEQIENTTEIIEAYMDANINNIDEFVLGVKLESIFEWGVEVIIRRR